ncbi:hypothetical protein BBF96_13760 [Anoxybacter fermentans]|uniref:Uncharacterized protein n=1 Tax=Anoxybacter fermentans TaxID=1323375 RepID=A0A3S9T1F6_9FIRM|nr:histidine phosphatase family protein [Anoxybacter fermentans]AZR74360.1 hypothetical protein BBF96_13760 [Anoxybacter fermentans]
MNQTSKIIEKILFKPPILVPDLRDLNNGMVANLNKEEAEKIVLPFTEPAIDWIPYPQAESWRMLNTRIVSFMEKINEDEHEITLIVSHVKYVLFSGGLS